MGSGFKRQAKYQRGGTRPGNYVKIKKHNNNFNKKTSKGITQFCDNVYDNVTKYSYNNTPKGHLAYVHCDYVV